MAERADVAGYSLEKLLGASADAAREAGQMVADRRRHLRPDEISHKTPFELVTTSDKMSEALIGERLETQFPEIGVLAEEGGARRGEVPYNWVIDPIDGTHNYAHDFPFYCVSIGLVGEEEGLLAGAIYHPPLDELFTARKGGGTFLNGSPVRVAETGRLADSMVATGFSYDEERGEDVTAEFVARMTVHCRDIRRMGATALHLCYVACGRLDGFWQLGPQPWDVAAGALLVQEAGGHVTQLDGAPFDVMRESVLAAPPELHPQMLKALKTSSQ